MKVTLFVGPTLPRAEIATRMPEAACLPPASQGDIYRAARRRPQAIGIVDGYFSGAPSVWHKEILWAISEGVPVFGSASMGALRAAELHLYGMRGVGRIFEAFRDGTLEDDDEVAVVHGPAELDFVAASDAMVNIRATLTRAEAEGIVSADTRSGLEAVGKALFFPQRSWRALLAAARTQQVASEDEVGELERWLPGNTVDQKREDALEMLAAMKGEPAAAATERPSFRFERTHLWDNLVATRADDQSDRSESGLLATSVVDELRLRGLAAYERAKSSALLRLLASRQAGPHSADVNPEALRAAAARIRAERSLFTRNELMSWIARNDLDERSFERLAGSEAQLSMLAAAAGRSLETFLLDELRLSGAYEALAARARRKASIVDLTLGSAGSWPAFAPNPLRLRLWFFEERLGGGIPEDVEAYVTALGFPGAGEFDRVLLREWLYCAREGTGDGTASAGTEGGSGA